MGTGGTITEVQWEHTGVKGPIDLPNESSKIDRINSTWLPDTLQFFFSWFPAVRTTLIFPSLSNLECLLFQALMPLVFFANFNEHGIPRSLY